MALSRQYGDDVFEPPSVEVIRSMTLVSSQIKTQGIASAFSSIVSRSVGLETSILSVAMYLQSSDGNPAETQIIWLSGSILGLVWCAYEARASLRAKYQNAARPAVKDCGIVTLLVLSNKAKKPGRCLDDLSQHSKPSIAENLL